LDGVEIAGWQIDFVAAAMRALRRDASFWNCISPLSNLRTDNYGGSLRMASGLPSKPYRPSALSGPTNFCWPGDWHAQAGKSLQSMG
jgi:hypothetical protein